MRDRKGQGSLEESLEFVPTENIRICEKSSQKQCFFVCNVHSGSKPQISARASIRPYQWQKIGKRGAQKDARKDSFF